MNSSGLSKLWKFATLSPMYYEQDTTIRNYDGTLMNVFHAPLIRALAKGLGMSFNIVIPEDDDTGYKKPDGNWTGIVGMIARGEADLSIGDVTASEERREAVNFSYPLHVTFATFMTDKPEPQPNSFAIFHVFSIEVWIGIGLCLFLISLLLYFLLQKRKSYFTFLFNCIGCLLEQSFSFDVRQRNTALLLLHWFIGVMVLTTSYKAVILSIITVPRMVGIRDISDLSKAAKENSIMCMTHKGCADIWINSSVDRFKLISACLKKGKIESQYYNT